MLILQILSLHQKMIFLLILIKIFMKIKLELFGASRDFSNKDYLEFSLSYTVASKDEWGNAGNPKCSAIELFSSSKITGTFQSSLMSQSLGG